MVFLEDPIGDYKHEIISGIFHRYKNRILILTHSQCPVNCRFCFRKNDITSNSHFLTRDKLKKLEDYLWENPNVNELVLSGGDPLILNDNTLENFFQFVGSIPQLKFLRIHSRTVISMPQRVTPELLQLLSNQKFKITIAKVQPIIH